MSRHIGDLGSHFRGRLGLPFYARRPSSHRAVTSSHAHHTSTRHVGFFLLLLVLLLCASLRISVFHLLLHSSNIFRVELERSQLCFVDHSKYLERNACNGWAHKIRIKNNDACRLTAGTVIQNTEYGSKDGEGMRMHRRLRSSSWWAAPPNLAQTGPNSPRVTRLVSSWFTVLIYVVQTCLSR